ncbi:MAG TPA: endonuclease V [Noviherbaspirillum sp.]|uniref:endonuclease V n=1 Tax=Noviherbaspirillum sp. TaxID=1926288 RepID=UPI002B4691C3|nr:endonuclease V [Noviherbaspirillum sp.]HJV84480.1 endonuclease V [Noviherbaspirillum sp.]
MTIGFLDVHYDTRGAQAACIVADSWTAEAALCSCVDVIKEVRPYQPGSFYLRELPCLISVLRLLPALPDMLVIDGYVWLPPLARAGLGARLYETLQRRVPVVGIAKTAFAGGEACADVVPVWRGTSGKPLFVTAAGVDIHAAAEWVRSLAGKHRLPILVSMADRLSRQPVAMQAVDFPRLHSS